MLSIYLLVRILHVLFGVLWAGSSVFAMLFLVPATRDVGLDGVKFALALSRRGFGAYFGIIAATTVLSGLWLYWRFTAGFSAEVSRTHAGMTFGLGGACGLVAFILGGAVIGPKMAASTRLAGEAAALPEGRERADKLARAFALRDTAGRAGQIVGVLVILATVLMTIARYI